MPRARLLAAQGATRHRRARLINRGALRRTRGSSRPPDIDAFVDRLIVVVEARKLGVGGGGGRDGKFEGFVTRMGRGSATENDRAVLAAFLAGEDAIVRHEVACCDAWSGWD